MECVSEYLLFQQFFSYIIVEQVNFQWDDDEDRPVLNQHAELIVIVVAHWNNSPRGHMSFHSDTVFRFRANQSLLFLFNAACLAEKQQLPIL